MEPTYYFVNTYQYLRKMMKQQLLKQKIDPDSFDRETILLGIFETQHN